MSMSRDPRRLVEYGDKLDGLVRGALDAERAEAADAARLSGIEAKLAQRLAQLPHAPGPSASPSLPEASPAPTPAPAVDPLGSRAVWLLVGAAVVVAGAVFVSRGASFGPDRASPATPVPTAHRAERAIAPLAAPAAPTATAEAAIATVSPADLPTAREPLVAPSARTFVRTPAPAQGEPSQGEEIALLARAHEALPARPAESLALCREHEQRFATGHFAQEREAVAIEALVYSHRKAEAERRFDAFRQRYPTSSHRGHLESLFSAAPASPR